MTSAFAAGCLSLASFAGTAANNLKFQEEENVNKMKEIDIVVYGGTSAGIAAAVQCMRMNKSVIIIEPSNRLGGLTTGGLGQTDIGKKAAIGGISREFYQRIRKYYDNPSNWKWQKREEYKSLGQSKTESTEDTMWTFEPSAALRVFQDMVDEAKIPVVYNERLDRKSGVRKDGIRIVSITMESGKTFCGKMFIDATYEGDLMASAGVSYHVGREANSVYGETLNGVQTRLATHHQFKPGVDPYVIKGEPKSGLLPGIDPTGPGKEGEGDHRVQAYCFRMCMTDHPDNRISFKCPEVYDEINYELLLRNFEAGSEHVPLHIAQMPNCKTDTNNHHGVSTDFIGQNYDYIEESYAEREKNIRRHLQYQQGLLWTLISNPRVPENIRKEVGRWGVCKDEFIDSEGWQRQLYIREGRRMIGSYVMTQDNCQGRRIAEDSVALAAYTMDSHNVQRYVDSEGRVRNEGDVQVGGFLPYQISFRSIVPRQTECGNMLVPVCLSASHIAFGSIRMEPVFMVLGQVSATAASLAIDKSSAIQEVEYSKLKDRLLSDRCKLSWNTKGKNESR